MANTPETIERLARKLERQRIYADLIECRTLEDFECLVKKYGSLCNDDRKDEE